MSNKNNQSRSIIKEREKSYYKSVAEKIKEFNENGKLTVAIYIDAFFPSVDGVVMVVDNLAKRLNKKCNVVVVTPKHEGYTVQREYLVIGVKSMFFKKYNYDASIFAVFDRNYKRIIKSLRVDVIHIHSPFFLGKLAKSLHKKRNVPLVASFHSQYKKDIYKSTGSEVLTDIVLKRLMSVFGSADELWTMHAKSAETAKEYGYKGKVVLMPNATDYVYPENAGQIIAETRKKYGVDNQVVFVFVGRLITQKNILFTAEVLKVLKDKGLSFKMFFIGDGPDRKVLESKISELGLNDEVRLLGNVSDKELIKSFYLIADLMLFPSKYDVSSIVQIEAASMKTACAFAEGSVTSYTVKNGVNAIVLPEEVQSFANGVYDFVTDKEKKQTISENAYRDLYVTWDEVVEKSISRYRDLIDEYKANKR